MINMQAKTERNKYDCSVALEFLCGYKVMNG